MVLKNYAIIQARLFQYQSTINSTIVMKSQKAFSKILTNVGASLAELREKKGYSTIKEFTRQYDLPEIQYWRIEKGKTNLTLKSLVRILAIHKVSLQDFFCLIAVDEPAN